MKNLKKILVKTLLFAMVLSMSTAMYAGAENELQNVYSQGFESFSLTNENFPESKIGYTAEVVNEALQIKSDNVTEWTLIDTTYPNANANYSNGIWVNCLSNNALQKQDPLLETSDGLFEYTGNSDTAWAIENIGGRDAIRMIYYPRLQSNGTYSYSSNQYRVSIEQGRFEAGRNAFDVELDLYFIDGRKPTRVAFMHKRADGSTARVYLEGDELKNAPVNEWYTWRFSVSNANFSDPRLIYSEATFVIYQEGNKKASTYIGRMSIAPSTDGEYLYGTNDKTVKIPFGLGEVYGNTRVSFDMNLPATERYDSLSMYNSGNNSMRVSAINENDKPIATVQIDSTDDGQSIYAVTGYGNVLLYEGEILGRTLSYQIDVDWKEKTYTLVIKNASEYIDGVTEMYGPYAIENTDIVKGNALVRGMFIEHNSASEKMLSIIDGIKVDYKEDPDYANCKIDAENLSLDLPESGIVTEAFDLPTVGETSGAEITWESSNPAVISISSQGDSFTLTRAATRVTVTLTATLDINGVKILKSFDVVVEKSDDQIKAEEDAAAIELPISGLAIEDFDLPTEGEVNGSAISWASSDSAIAVVNNKAVLTRGAKQTEVTLTATANFNGYVAKRDIIVVVCEHEDFLKAKADVDAIVLNIPKTGRVKDAFTLPSEGVVNSSAITWATSDASIIAISGNTAQVTRYETNKEVTLTASATLGDFTATRKIKITSATLRGVSAEIGIVQETVSNGYLSANVNVQYPGKTGTLNFVVLITNPETGEILARGVDTKPLSNATRYATIPCSVSNLPFEEGNVAEYYVWNDKRESFVNNEPTAVTELTAIGRGKGVRLDWNAVIDDNNAVEYYEVFRDGEYIGTSAEETYLDESAQVGVVYDYEVRGVDANDLPGDADEEVCTPALGMYYFNFEKMAKGEEIYSNGLSYRQSAVPTSDSYSWFAEVVDANGVKSMAATSTDRNIIGSTDKKLISGSDADITVEIDYLDTTGGIRMIYNGIIPKGEEDSLKLSRKSVNIVPAMGGTYEWKTAVVRLTDAQFRNSHYWSASDFGFASTTPGKMFVREIRMIQTDLYN